MPPIFLHIICLNKFNVCDFYFPHLNRNNESSISSSAEVLAGELVLYDVHT